MGEMLVIKGNNRDGLCTEISIPIHQDRRSDLIANYPVVLITDLGSHSKSLDEIIIVEDSLDDGVGGRNCDASEREIRSGYSVGIRRVDEAAPCGCEVQPPVMSGPKRIGPPCLEVVCGEISGPARECKDVSTKQMLSSSTFRLSGPRGWADEALPCGPQVQNSAGLDVKSRRCNGELCSGQRDSQVRVAADTFGESEADVGQDAGLVNASFLGCMQMAIIINEEQQLNNELQVLRVPS
ncbi:rho GTPase-activating protein 18-like [Sesbania bispinosa]|nr:rho GTPase-activating protein 18-like [Sesbania bispinosa]